MSETEDIFLSLKQKIAIVGYGDFGHAIGAIVQRAGVDFFAWDPNPEKRLTASLSETVDKADIIFFAVPTEALQKAIEASVAFIKEGAIIVFVSKGLDNMGRDAVKIARGYFPENHIVFMGGPMITENIIKGEKYYPVLAGGGRARDSVAELFTDDFTSITFSDDIDGVAGCGVLKNFYAFLLGFAEGEEWSEEEKEDLLAKCLEEMSQSVETFGGKSETAMGMAGVEDLKFSATMMSDNFSDGIRFAKGIPAIGSESVKSAEAMKKAMGVVTAYPLLMAACDIITKNKNISQKIKEAIKQND